MTSTWVRVMARSVKVIKQLGSRSRGRVTNVFDARPTSNPSAPSPDPKAVKARSARAKRQLQLQGGRQMKGTGEETGAYVRMQWDGHEVKRTMPGSQLSVRGIRSGPVNIDSLAYLSVDKITRSRESTGSNATAPRHNGTPSLLQLDVYDDDGEWVCGGGVGAQGIFQMLAAGRHVRFPLILRSVGIEDEGLLNAHVSLMTTAEVSSEFGTPSATRPPIAHYTLVVR